MQITRPARRPGRRLARAGGDRLWLMAQGALRRASTLGDAEIDVVLAN
jgi:hypothetical protein